MATTALSKNWRQLQKTLEKAPSTTLTDPLKRKSPSDGSSTTSSSSSTTTRAKKTKRARGTPHSATATMITNPANPPSIPQTSKPIPTSKASKMSVTTAKPSATLALWAEDNDISPADLRKAYNLPSTGTTLPLPTSSTIQPEASGASSATEAGKYISLDCEMVGVGGPTNERSALARVSIVNYHGHVILDTFVRPKEKVTDWRSWVSGVTPAHMIHARTFEDVQEEVSSILTDRVLVGHAVQNDLEALLLSHPGRDVRDTSRHPGFRKLNAGRPPGLKKLARELLEIEIQGREHSSVEDARACMLLYRKFRNEIEKFHKPKLHKPKGASSKSDKKKRKEKKKEKRKEEEKA